MNYAHKLARKVLARNPRTLEETLLALKEIFAEENIKDSDPETKTLRIEIAKEATRIREERERTARRAS